MKTHEALITDILSRLRAAHIPAVVAGGFPRDLVLGVPPRDIDLYVSCNQFPDAEEILFGGSQDIEDTFGDEYEHQYVQIQTERESALSPNHPVNLIGLRWDRRVKAKIDGAEIVSRFNVGLSQVWMDLSEWGTRAAVSWTDQFVADAGARRITILRDDWGREGTAKTVRKLKAKYPEFAVRMLNGDPYDEESFLAPVWQDVEPL